MHGVSFVICTYNGAQRLPTVLERLSRQDNPTRIPAEILVIDNASNDGTAEVVLAHADRLDIHVQVIREPRQGLSFARVTGLNSAKYDLICFVDDDNWVPADWLWRVESVMASHPGVGACGGYISPVFATAAPGWFETAKERYAVSTETRANGWVRESGGFLAGAGLTVRKSAWRQLWEGGFEFRTTDRRGLHLSSGGDAELCLALRLAGWDLWFDYALLLHHYLPADRLNWKYARRLYRGCASCAAVLDAYVHVLDSQTPPRDRLDRYRKAWGGSWLWYASSAARWLLTNPTAVLSASFGEGENNFRVLETEMYFGRFLSYVQLRGEYDRLVRELVTAPWRKHQPVCAEVACPQSQ